jgi:hypothetical protein
MEPNECAVDIDALLHQYQDNEPLMPLLTGGHVLAEVRDCNNHMLYVIRDENGVHVAHAEFESPIYPKPIPSVYSITNPLSSSAESSS